jgi:hypothetical protein
MRAAGRVKRLPAGAGPEQPEGQGAVLDVIKQISRVNVGNGVPVQLGTRGRPPDMFVKDVVQFPDYCGPSVIDAAS